MSGSEGGRGKSGWWGGLEQPRAIRCHGWWYCISRWQPLLARHRVDELPYLPRSSRHAPHSLNSPMASSFAPSPSYVCMSLGRTANEMPSESRGWVCIAISYLLLLLLVIYRKRGPRKVFGGVSTENKGTRSGRQRRAKQFSH